MKPPTNILLTTLFVITCYICNGQDNATIVVAKNYFPKTTSIRYRLGETQMLIKQMQYGDVNDVVYINLHDDEQSSVEAAQSLLKREGGLLVKFENNRKRNIRFRLKGKYYTFDPNRMFSREGAAQSLRELGRVSNDAVNEVVKLGQRIIQFIPENPSLVVALHNNTEGRFGINSYRPGSPIAVNAKLYYENPDDDPDDIFLTTDSILYHRLSNEKFNSIWQDNINARRDGSLSVYCGERNIRYVNCETQHGKTEKYLTMLLAITAHVEKINSQAVTYNYRLTIDDHSLIKPGQEIYFGEKKVGEIKSTGSDDSLTVSGILEIDKTFELHSNAEFFFILSAHNTPRLEIRIDPTKEKQPLNLVNDVIFIITKK
jgi:hypothetical protein